MEAISPRAFLLLIYVLVSQSTCCFCCHDMPNSAVRLVNVAYGELSATALNVMVLVGLPDEMQTQLVMIHCSTKEGVRKALEKLKPIESGSAGCVSFGNNEQNQCTDLECPEVHVETCSNPCMMTTQAFSVPKSCCNGPCCNAPRCSAPYCSIPAPQPTCSLPPPPPPPLYATTTCYTTPCANKCPRPPPPQRPVPQMINSGCCCPYQYPQQMASPAPSYCVQSVVVGGKADAKKDDDKGKDDEEGKGRGKPEDNVGKGRETPETGSPEGGRQTGAGRPGGRGPGAGLYLDPIDLRAGGLRGRLGGADLSGIPGLFAGGGPFRLPFPGLGREEDASKRYENYLEKILDVIKDKVEPESVGPSPIMVMQDCSPRVKVRKIRRRKKQRKYMLHSVEAPDDEIVEEEEESPCSCFFTPCCSHSRLRRRHFL